MRLYQNKDPTIGLVRQFEEKAEKKGRRSLVRDAQTYAEELGMKLELQYPLPSGSTDEGESIEGKKIGPWVKEVVINKRCENIRQQRWQGKLVTARWEDEDLDKEWLAEWRMAPTHSMAGINELYEQLLPTKLYHSRKTKTREDLDATCRMCGEAQESVAHVLAGCNALAQTKYLARHNAAIKIIFFELLKDYLLIQTTPPWYSPIQPKPVYENNQVTAYWDVPVYAYNTEVRANRVDARFVDKGSKIVTLVEMTCPWTENRHQNNQEKTQKYAALRSELKQQYPGFEIRQVNLIVDVLGGYSENIGRSVRELLGVKRGREVLRQMQKAVLSAGLSIARTFKVLS